MFHFPELHHFSVTSGDGRKMIKEAATWAASSRRTCRRCGLNMKGLWPLHASPEGLIGFFDSLAVRCAGGFLQRKAGRGLAAG
jgi:hypothetical protein